MADLRFFNSCDVCFTNHSHNATELDPLDVILFEKIFATFIIFLIPFILGGNILVLLAVMTFQKLQTVTNYFIVSLAVADLMVGGATIPMYAAFYLQVGDLVRNKTACLLQYALVIASCGASLLNLLFIAIDRYIAVVYPLRYNSLVTPKRARLAIFSLWVYITFVSLLPTMGVNLWDEDSVCDFYKIFPRFYVIFASFLLVSVCLLLSTVLYVRIFHEARIQHKKMLIEHANRSPEYKRKLEKDLKSSKVMAIVLFMFVVFWLPYLSSAPLKLYSPYSDNLITIIKNFALCLSMSNSVINPIIYALLRREFRAAFKSVLYIKYHQFRRFSHQGIPQLSTSSAGHSKTVAEFPVGIATGSKVSETVGPCESNCISLNQITLLHTEDGDIQIV